MYVTVVFKEQGIMMEYCANVQTLSMWNMSQGQSPYLHSGLPQAQACCFKEEFGSWFAGVGQPSRWGCDCGSVCVCVKPSRKGVSWEWNRALGKQFLASFRKYWVWGQIHKWEGRGKSWEQRTLPVIHLTHLPTIQAEDPVQGHFWPTLSCALAEGLVNCFCVAALGWNVVQRIRGHSELWISQPRQLGLTQTF